VQAEAFADDNVVVGVKTKGGMGTSTNVTGCGALGRHKTRLTVEER
jgi:hypothetical protein